MTSNDTPPQPSILVVDDDERLAQVLEFVLKRGGYAVQTAFSGQSALDWLKHHTAHVIILDLMMPDITGFNFLRQLRANAATTQVPVIVLTARADQESRLRSEAMGANDFLIKPISSEALLEHVRKVLGQNDLLP
jgi:DNA-binding response OmpR family regulator